MSFPLAGSALAPSTTPHPTAPAWHRLTPEEVHRRLESSTHGLSEETASERLRTGGPNEIVDQGTTSPWRLIWAQLSAVMVLILIGATLLSLVLGKFVEAGAIGAIVVLFTLLGFFQEYRAEQAIAALRKMAVPTVRVTRGGRVTEVASAEIVPGDVVHLEAGTIVPADLRLVEVAGLRIEEAALTGESEAVDKDIIAIDADDVALGDRRCMAYSGTQVAAGRGVGVVVATGMATELGRIAALLQGLDEEATPLQTRLDQVGKQLALAGVVVAGLVVLMGALSGESLSDLALTAISVAVAVIPEGLPAVVTFTLAIGSQRMLRRNALIRKLPAVETLGSVTVICSDKTGTLTENRMTVTSLDVADHTISRGPGEAVELDKAPDALRLMLGAIVLCNDAQLDVDEDGSLRLIGDPTETALLVVAHDSGIDVGALRAGTPRLAEQPFDSVRKRMSTVHQPSPDGPRLLAAVGSEAPVAFVKGSIDGLLDVATHVLGDDGPVALDEAWRVRVTTANESLASTGRRVLGVAMRTLDPADPPGDVEHGLTLIGLVGLIDPPRPEVRSAVAVCRRAGIRPVMITGDHPLTALAIARDLGIADGDRTLTGLELDALDDGELADAVSDVSVFARVSPENKLRIVEALQHQGHVAAMTGDGVNDAPALKRADIGVAMGITGTDVSKEAADMVLRDDNFTTIVAAVEEGRVIYDNLRRFVSFAVAGNLGKIIVMLGWPIPFLVAGDADAATAVALLPLQLLWLNLMTDGLLGLSMGVEPAERTVMQRPPHAPGASLWAGGLGRRTVWIGTVIGAVALAVGFAYYAADRAEWQTMIFSVLAFLQIAQTIGTRSNHDSLRTIGLTTNRLMLAIVALVLALQLAAVLTPIGDLLDLERLGAGDLAICVGLALAFITLLEGVKAAGRRRPAQHGALSITDVPTPEHTPVEVSR